MHEELKKLLASLDDNNEQPMDALRRLIKILVEGLEESEKLIHIMLGEVRR